MDGQVNPTDRDARWERAKKAIVAKQQQLVVKPQRRCPRCDKPVYYGIYCSNECSDAGYEKWKRENPDLVGLEP